MRRIGPGGGEAHQCANLGRHPSAHQEAPDRSAGRGDRRASSAHLSLACSARSERRSGFRFRLRAPQDRITDAITRAGGISGAGWYIDNWSIALDITIMLRNLL